MNGNVLGINESPDGVNKTVFNCALNPAMKKRKKIPRVIPPPPTDLKPFWKEPLPMSQDDDKDGAQIDQSNRQNLVSPDIIRMKLEDKRRKEMEQLREIQMNQQVKLTQKLA